MIYPLFRRVLRQFGLLQTQSSYVTPGNTPANSSGYRRRKYHHPLSVPETKWESDEQYILQPQRPGAQYSASNSVDNRDQMDGIKVTFETTVNSSVGHDSDSAVGHKTATGCPGRDLARMDSRNLPRFVP